MNDGGGESVTFARDLSAKFLQLFFWNAETFHLFEAIGTVAGDETSS